MARPMTVHGKADSLWALLVFLAFLCTPTAVFIRYLGKDFFEVPALILVGAISAGLCAYLFIRLRAWEFLWVYFYEDHIVLRSLPSHFFSTYLRLHLRDEKVYYRDIRGVRRQKNYVAIELGLAPGREVLVQCSDHNDAEKLRNELGRHMALGT